MPAELHDFLASDHERLDVLLARCRDSIDAVAYDAFRRGLLRHISMEERVLFPLLRAKRGRTEIEHILHRDHATLTALLVPPPTIIEIEQIASILEPHNLLEEEHGGMYELIEDLAADDLTALMTRVHAIPEVRVQPNVDKPLVRETIAYWLKQRE